MKRLLPVGPLFGALGALLLLPPLSGCGPKSGTAASAQDTTGENAPVALASAPASGGSAAFSGSSTNPSKTDLQMALGNPDKATTSASNAEHYLLRRSQYALSYNDTLRFPNWVSWHLIKADIGSEPRGAFTPDPDLPRTFTKITPSDYTNSGYDRGHNCPAKDRSANPTDSKAVFYMSNMTPQQHGMNAGPWEQLESYSRDLTGENELFITCGHGFSDKKRKTIGTDKIAVPDFGWKIVVVVPKGAGNPVSRITPTTRVIAVRMPNISTIIKNDWRQYRTSVQDIESATGLTFFDALPKVTAEALKNRVDFDMSAPPKGKRTEAETLPGPKSGGDTQTVAPPANATGQVWVNTKSKAYWKPGTEYYGKTKQGKYMTEADAIKAGYHAAGGQ